VSKVNRRRSGEKKMDVKFGAIADVFKEILVSVQKIKKFKIKIIAMIISQMLYNEKENR
jgi:hypothetical protein